MNRRRTVLLVVVLIAAATAALWWAMTAPAEPMQHAVHSAWFAG